jgi:hypothetical protein
VSGLRILALPRSKPIPVDVATKSPIAAPSVIPCEQLYLCGILRLKDTLPIETSGFGC